jgi:hypothetical protein
MEKNISDGNNFITPYKNTFISVWSYNNNIYVKNIDVKLLHTIEYGERIVSIAADLTFLYIGIDSLKYCRIIAYNLSTFKSHVTLFQRHTLVGVFISKHYGVCMVTHCYGEPPQATLTVKNESSKANAKAVIYTGIYSDFKRVISIENVYSAPFCLMNDPLFVLAWQDVENNLQLVSIDIETSKILRNNTPAFWCYIVGVYNSNKIYLSGFIPNVGIEIYKFDSNLKLIFKKLIKTGAAAPHLFSVGNINYLAIEPYTNDYSVDIYSLDELKLIKTMKNTIDPSFAVNSNSLSVLKLTLDSTIICELINLDIDEFHVIN